jgi:ABC-type transport system involved in multi-copper enzyme maturation permease subunit
MNRTIRAFRAVAIEAFLEGIRARTLYNVFFVSLFFLGVGYLAALLVYGHQDRVLLHFGLLVNAFSVFTVSAGAGARTIHSEIDQRTTGPVLARPISRSSYYFGKWAGILAFSTLNLALLYGLLALGLHGAGGSFSSAFVRAFLQSFGLTLAESAVVSSFALFLSLFFRPGITVLITLSYFFLAHNHGQLALIATEGGEGGVLIPVLMRMTPDAGAWLMDTRVYYQQPLETLDWLLRAGYGTGWALVFAFFGNAVFYRKNL